ncbi:Cutinase [Mycena chlorophos]|uniref:cutinase n=1 Tax=Mycena chlorophos TaxID=658473 RepID=A0A8H6STW6_MYCCL|nr:Cutinase [Mycena chlorophos]
MTRPLATLVLFIQILALFTRSLAIAHPPRQVTRNEHAPRVPQGLLGGLLGDVGSLADYLGEMGDVMAELAKALAEGNPGQGDYGGAGCKDVMVIFAKGTTESNTIGDTVGPAFLNATLAALANFDPATTLSFKGVPYSADFLGFFEGGSPEGSATMAYMLQNVTAQCPNAPIVAVGYSQGGQIVHNAAQILAAHDPSVLTHIKAVVIFGDPDEKQALPNEIPPCTIDEICHSGDVVCGSAGKDAGYGSVPRLGLLLATPFIGLTLPQHLNYQNQTEMDDAARFVVRTVFGESA